MKKVDLLTFLHIEYNSIMWIAFALFCAFDKKDFGLFGSKSDQIQYFG